MQDGWIHYSSDLFVLNLDERVRFLYTNHIHKFYFSYRLVNQC